MSKLIQSNVTNVLTDFRALSGEYWLGNTYTFFANFLFSAYLFWIFWIKQSEAGMFSNSIGIQLTCRWSGPLTLFHIYWMEVNVKVKSIEHLLLFLFLLFTIACCRKKIAQVQGVGLSLTRFDDWRHKNESLLCNMSRSILEHKSFLESKRRARMPSICYSLTIKGYP